MIKRCHYYQILLIIISSILIVSSQYSFASQDQQKQQDYAENADYQYELYMARGALSFAEGYFGTAIKNFKKAITIKPDSKEAKARYTQAIFFKKLGVLMESTSSG